MLGKFKSFDEIVAPLQRMADDLDRLQQRNAEVRDKNIAEIERRNQHNLELEAENQRANKVLEFLGGAINL